MTHYTPFVSHRTQEATHAYHGEFEHSPAKRRRVENEFEQNMSAQTEVNLNPHTYNHMETSTSTCLWAYESSTYQFGQQMTVVDRSVPDAGMNGWKFETNWNAQSQFVFTDAMPQADPATGTEFHAQCSTSILHHSVSIPAASYEYFSEPMPTDNVSRRSSCTPSANNTEANQVCFGMITDLQAELDMALYLPLHDRRAAVFSSPCGLYIGGSLAGTFDERSAQILQVLSEDPLIDIQIILPIPAATMGKPKKLTPGRFGWSPVSINVYGSKSFAGDVGNFCQTCNLYLQDPLECDRNVPYCNPHRFALSEDEPRLTFDLNETSLGKTVTQLHYSNLLDSLVSSGALHELETPPHLRTALLPHQRQALYFMTQRELGWAYEDTSCDIWTKVRGTHHDIYRNNITGTWQQCRPTQFKGGILADAMGLGKSCSMIALMANDWQGDSSHPTALEEGIRGIVEVSATLLIVPPSLILTWEEQLQRHLKSPQSLRIRRHHASRRVLGIDELRRYDVIITTYQTVESEWRTCSQSKPLPLFAAHWRRIVLDEDYVSNRSSNTFKAICDLNAHARWAVTGTPLQNRLGDLATICQFLRVYPYDDRETFERDLVSLWKAGHNDTAISRLKRLFQCILLRRTQGIVDLPTRTDLKFSLKLNHEERDYYSAVESNVASTIDAALNNSSHTATTFASIIQQINELRLICNLGTHRKSAKKTCIPDSGAWNSRTAQRALSALGTTDIITCNVCSLDLNASMMQDGLGSDLILCSTRVMIFSCLKIVCESCMSQDLRLQCGCTPSCLSATALYTPGSTVSEASSPAPSVSDTPEESLPTKIKALVTDLLDQPMGTKSIVFSFWTSTLDLVEKGLLQGSINYTRYDGNTSQSNRSRALKRFREDKDLPVILMTISCSAVGLDITAASRAYIMEPQWNPTVEEQALARVHRMGQTREVTTIRFVMEGTFEERVVETQEKKRELADLLLSSDLHTEKEHSLDRLKYFRSLLK
ncbi:uncharacterized protein K460DRAFT_305410 [Cucurbitaria berberidis CBS 394.84]|uniref:Uncharacterized protein n=1 Tax=Cucurbitaria berberidis CBS 394.84 TaxID=1168544 RepID=A0A9P4GQ99_9PLEO|nr:uncharacterized protein K460DRAFT_305410 [Cucurbitaria berberidis CBS 394.84]KAF1849354.1 hypothetical protein K460DRAFT_305410 [Cucurbitaria berberidis CBS 394.84]